MFWNSEHSICRNPLNLPLMATDAVITIIIVINNAVNITFILTYEQSQAISLNVCPIFHNQKNKKCLEIYSSSLYHCYRQKRFLENSCIMYKFDYRHFPLHF